MAKPRREKISNLHRLIHRWYGAHQREFQWRTTKDPYEILVSEIMLQQTQVNRVKVKLPLFLRKFPTMRQLAAASKPDVVRAWEGMGYNNRAIRLREMARIVCEQYSGRIPTDAGLLEQLPGIGKYTSHAILCFAYRNHVPLVDVNIRRVLSRLFWKMNDAGETKPEKEIWALAAEILPMDSYTWNQALMDLGATICTARHTECERCPVHIHCASRRALCNSSQKLLVRQRPMRKTEPMYDGIPHRIWRGRIVERLRHINGGSSIRLRKVGLSIRPNFRNDELPWLRSLVDALVRDGIVETRGRGSATMVKFAS